MAVRYMISLDLKNKKCLVVGGGKVAERKVRSLLECEALVCVVSPEIIPALSSMAAEGLLLYRRGSYKTSDLEDMFLVFGATGKEEVNRQIADDCAGRNLIVNIVDDPAKCNFYVPATVRRGSLAIAVSTGGKSPLLARKIREELELVYGPQYEDFLEMLGALREEVIKNVSDPEKKKNKLESLVSDEILNMLKKGRLEPAKEMLLGAYHGSRS
ncbi:MAG: bifunctional precorrin-2 dehydrogenase/sirohydrochlorin ferrochelatase [Desulfotomaculaceae bacterium]|nr:bifunctional precorrin-2 dehydrogenase/sirohydrochlorin ferrochelatase [Desulfotomaculaceae bacterium]